MTHLTIGGAVLVISQTQAVHEHIAALLDRLYEAKQPAAGKDKDSPLYVFKPTPAEEKILAALDAPAEGTLRIRHSQRDQFAGKAVQNRDSA